MNDLENGVVRCRPGYTLKLKLKCKLRNLVIYERKAHGHTLEKVSLGSGIPLSRLEGLETRHRHQSWYIIDRLLQFYHKQLEIRLVEWDEE